MNDLLTEMTKAHHSKEIEGFYVDLWDRLYKHDQRSRLDSMKAALEVLKNPPEEFLEAMVEHMYAMSRLVDLGDTHLDETDMQRLLQAAINQTLKDDEDGK